MNNSFNEIPFNQRPILSIQEAVKYFGIGESHLRKIIRDDIKSRDVKFSLRNGNKYLIKRKNLEEYLLNTTQV